MRNLIGTAAVLAALSVGTSAAQDDNKRRATQTGAEPRAAVGTSGTICRAGFDPLTTTLTPPDNTASDNPPAGNVRLRKGCTGDVLVSFTSEVNATGADDFIHLIAVARCIDGSGPDPCAPGSEIHGAPNGDSIFFANGPIADTASYAAQWVFRDLGSGLWRFLVRPGGDGTASLGYRTTRVDAYSDD